MIQVNYKIGYNNCLGWENQIASATGQTDIAMDIKNLSDKPIKYCSIWFIPYNAVGDAVECSIKREKERGVKITGPIDPDSTKKGAVFSCAWFNSQIKSAKLTEAVIEYMDGTKETIKGDKIEPIPYTPPPVQTTPTSTPQTTSGGCYVATAVYGSYDCPQVWTLRRYRDYTLAETWYGRAFIRTYYAISPTLVKWFGDTKWFKKMWQGKLDRMVEKLQSEGVKSTPYEDKNW